MENVTTEFREDFYDNIVDILNTFLENEMNFTIMITPEDNWSIPFSDEIKETIKGNKPLTLNISEQSLMDSYITDNGNLLISTGFNGVQATKEVNVEEIIAIIDSETGQPILITPFKREIKREIKRESSKEVSKDIPKNKKELIESLIEDGISPEGAINSVEALMKNNTKYKEKFK